MIQLNRRSVLFFMFCYIVIFIPNKSISFFICISVCRSFSFAHSANEWMNFSGRKRCQFIYICLCPFSRVVRTFERVNWLKAGPLNSKRSSWQMNTFQFFSTSFPWNEEKIWKKMHRRREHFYLIFWLLIELKDTYSRCFVAPQP